MSADIYLVSQKCDKCGHEDHYGDWNITYNLTPMFREASGIDGFSALRGMTVTDALPKLEAAETAMETNPNRFRAFNPSNGWGTFDYLIKTIREIIVACREHPDAVFDGWF